MHTPVDGTLGLLPPIGYCDNAGMNASARICLFKYFEETNGMSKYKRIFTPLECEIVKYFIM